MATVWRVRGPGGRVHALKEMRPQAEARREMNRRFKQEFEVTSQLSHRNVVAVHDFFAAQDTLHIVMEWVDGLDLRDVLRFAGTLDDGRIGNIGGAVASGLVAAHAKGILHRDLKPENVLLSRRGEVKVTDFGVARLQGTRLTATGIIVGSPAYMSPEQLAGVSGQKLQASSDIYALGVLLYELGEGRDPLGLRKHEDLLTVLRVKREKSPRKFKNIRNPELADLILQCLQPREEDRPESMEVVARRLRRVARTERTTRADVKFLATLALENKETKQRAKGARAPLREVEPAPPEPARGRAAKAAPASAPWAGAEAADSKAAPGRGKRRPAPPKRPEPRPAPSPAALDRAERGAHDRDFGSGNRQVSRVDHLSVKSPRARGEVSVLSWLVLLLFGLAVIFLGASTSLTGSPLGLLEVLVPIP